MLYLFLILVICPALSAQVNPGARQLSVCNSNTASPDDVFSLFTNPAGCTLIKNDQAGVFYSPAPFGLKELANYGAVYSHYLGFGNISTGVTNFGYDLYRETRFIVSCGVSLPEELFLGASVNYQIVSIKNYGKAGCIILNSGLIALIADNTLLGFSIINLNNAEINGHTGQLPVIFRSGISTTFSDVFTCHFLLQKETGYNFSAAGGSEYRIFNILSVRSGFCTYPVQYSAGAGINYNLFTLDYGFTFHRELGLTHQVSILINFPGTANGNNEKINGGTDVEI